MKKILLVCNTSNSVITFRKKLIEKLQANGYSVSAVAFDDQCQAEIEAMGVEFYCLADKNRSVNPLKILSLKRRYCKLIKKLHPDVVFTFMLKPNIFGVKAAAKAGVKEIYSMVEGAGDVFINNSFKWKAIRFFVCKMYKSAFKRSKKVFFLNEDDKAEFIERKLVQAEQCEIVHGIGVDLSHFAVKPMKNDRSFLMVARMLKTKGVLEYCLAARTVRAKYPDATFSYLGGEGSLKLADIQEFIDDGSVKYLGVTSDVRPYYEECTVNVLPSYREGCSVTIMEAAAAGRPILTTRTNGCKDSVKDGYNGFLVDVGNAAQLAEKMIWFIENPEHTKVMGENARKFAEENFDSEKINEKIFSIING